MPPRLRWLAVVPALAFASPALASLNPDAPLFVLKWGSNGVAVGQFGVPYGVAADPEGNVYVTDQSTNRVAKFTRTGSLLLRWGAAGNGAGQFDRPSNVAVDSHGDVYVADTFNHRIQKFTSTGAFILAWGSEGTGDGQFSSPVGIAIDAAGNVYVTDTFNDRVQRFTSTGAFVTAWGSEGAAFGQFDEPNGIAVDGQGRVYVSDQNCRVQVFSGDGTFLDAWGSNGQSDGEFSRPSGMAIDAVGNVYVADYSNDRIQKFTSTGDFLLKWGLRLPGDGGFSLPTGVAVDAAGNVYVTDSNNSRVQKFSGAGAPAAEGPPGYLLQWGSHGPGVGEFDAPSAVAADADGNVFVADTYNQRVQKFTSTGTFVTQWSSIDTPSGIAVDDSGNVYVATGGGTKKFTGSGTFLATLSGGTSIAVDPSGNLYFTANNRVYVTRGDGTPVTSWSAPLATAIAVDRVSRIVYAARNGHVQAFTNTGLFLTQWDVPSGPPGFPPPCGIAITPNGHVVVTDPSSQTVQMFTSWGTPLATFGTQGAGNGEFDQPVGVGVDATGNVYVTEWGNSRVQKFAQAPSITMISDVPNDEGEHVTLHVHPTSAEAPGAGATIASYDVYRRDDTLPHGGDPGSGDWSLVASFPATGTTDYDFDVPTLANANPTTPYYTAFRVTAVAGSSGSSYESATGDGYSVDNIAPPPPTGLVAANFDGATHLHWDPSAAPDVAGYLVYRDVPPDFQPSEENFAGSTADTGFVDPGPSGLSFKIAAIDSGGNVGPYALIGHEQTTAVGDPRFMELAIEPVRPNPYRGERLAVTFSLPSAMPAELDLIDIAGRRVAHESVGALGAGRYRVELAAGRGIPAGVYLVRLRQGNAVKVTRVAWMR